MSDEPLKLRFLGSLVEQLGAQMYPSATATIAELVSNAWDADAENVWVSIPFNQSWSDGDRIVVTDDGVGMSREEAQRKYLVVGRKRRVVLGTDKTEGGRPLHGRKGIGKLAAFGTARVLDCHTVSAKGGGASFRLHYDDIRALSPAEDYEVTETQGSEPLKAPDGTELKHGTRIALSKLRLKQPLNEERFRRSMSRRFALDAGEMDFFINRELIERFDYPVQFRFPTDGVPKGVEAGADGWAEEQLDDGRSVRWWMGFTEKPLDDQSLQGISVLANRKMVQRPFLFQRAQGIAGQLGQEYLVGEVRADWLDEGLDIESDRIQANRDQLQLEDAELETFMAWGRRRLVWALGRRNALRVQETTKKVELAAETESLFSGLTRSEKSRYMGVARTITAGGEMPPEGVYAAMKGVMEARDDVYVREMWDEIEQEAPDIQAKIWDVVHRFGLIDARRNQTIIEARLRTIYELKRFVSDGATEVPTIHSHVKNNTWLLDPRWHLLDDEIKLSDLGIAPDPGESDGQMDYLFALGSSNFEESDEIVVVEIKRATKGAGERHAASEQELNRFASYVNAAKESVEKNSNPPAVTGLFVAQDFTRSALRQKRLYEQARDPRLMFRTWDRVIRDTERIHTGWLAVTTRRAAEDD
ncbi:MAG: ATP-binding protein [Chloroflexota bacterium]|nr:ATP-binding protein [Chloroflexota bacterium]